MSQPPLIRIQLDAEQSHQLSQAGPGAFSIVGRASYPGDPSRWILNLTPVEWKTAAAACHVLRGTHRATKIKPASSVGK
jgi:hypothetical protein